jgi:uncharacterized membrane protein
MRACQTFSSSWLSRHGEGMPETVLVVSRMLAGLLAGVYLAFLLAVMPALHSQPDDIFVKVMNRINVVIVNPIFMVLFLGTPIVTAVLLRWNRDAVTVAAVVTAVLAVVVTVAVNIPLNNALANGGPRAAFETPWIAWHVVRTLLTCASLGLLALPRAAAG